MAYKGIRVRYILAGASVASAAIGSGVTYVVMHKRLEKKFGAISEREISEAKDFYEQQFKLNKVGPFSDPETLAEVLVPEEAADAVTETLQKASAALHTYKPTEVVDYNSISTEARTERTDEPVVEEVVVEEKVTVKNIFQNEPGEWNQELEEAKRNPLFPYIISHEEFLECEYDYEQVQLTYFEGDDVLMGSDDRPIDDTASVVGDENLNRFGYGSNDRNIVYIRNENITLDMEVLRSEGKYHEEVLGFMEHSEGPRIRKFRHED